MAGINRKNQHGFQQKMLMDFTIFSKEQLNQRIQELLGKVIENVTSSKVQLTEIKRLFSNIMYGFMLSIAIIKIS